MYGKKNSGEKTNQMPESEVSSDENSTSSDVENDILEDLGDKKKVFQALSVWAWEGDNNIGSRYWRKWRRVFRRKWWGVPIIVP